MSKISIYIGYDLTESVAYHVLSHSIMTRASAPVSITPLCLSSLPELMRPRDFMQSSAFSFSRWLVPFLNCYKGWAIYMDCDMLCLGDIMKLWKLSVDLRHEESFVQVVKHDFVPKITIKHLGNVQTTYEKKNWSSLMIFNCEKCIMLTPDYINVTSGLNLHQFKWIPDGEVDKIDSLPVNWNYLVGHNTRDNIEGPPELVHFTEGGPWIAGDKKFSSQEYALEWFSEFQEMTYATSCSIV